MDGFVNLRKPSGPTSHDMVARVRRVLGTKKVGHAGTLDPMAEGVLVLCVGKATRVVEYVSGSDKEYIAEVTLGLTTDTLDSTGNTLEEKDASQITSDDVERVIHDFSGEVSQLPPAYSAVKKDGKPLYKYAREGKEVQVEPRRVNISEIELVTFVCDVRPKAIIRVVCSAGTYIRTLASDMGERLGCGAVMSALERTRSGRFHIKDSVTMEELEKAREQNVLDGYIIDMAKALRSMPQVVVDSDCARRIVHGLTCIVEYEGEAGVPVCVTGADGQLLAIATINDDTSGRVLAPKKVLAQTD